MKTRTLTLDDMPQTYADLAGLFMPRPLHDAADYRNALGLLDAMAGFEMNADQADYFEAIATFAVDVVPYLAPRVFTGRAVDLPCGGVTAHGKVNVIVQGAPVNTPGAPWT